MAYLPHQPAGQPEGRLTADFESKSPISTLSDDVLKILFEAVADSCRSRGERVDVALILSHVCREWRFTALDLPTLWSTFTSERAGALSVIAQLDKARSVPITVVWEINSATPGQRRNVEQLEMILGHHQQLRAVHLHFQIRDQLTILRLLCCPTPQLRSLHLHTEELSAHERPSSLLVNLPIYSPSLQSLSLGNLPWIGSAAEWKYMTEISVCDTISLMSKARSLSGVMEKLHEFTHLEYLKFHAYSRLSPERERELEAAVRQGGPTMVSPSVYFSRLRALDVLFADLHSAVEFCHRFSVPPSCSVSLTCQGQSTESSPSNHPALLVPHIFPAGMSLRPVERLVMSDSEMWNEPIQIFCVGRVETQDQDEAVHTALSLSRISSAQKETVALAAWALFDLSSVRTLELRLKYILPRPSIREGLLVPCALTTEHLVLEGSVVAAFVEYCSEGLSQQPSQFHFPLLRALGFSVLTLRRKPYEARLAALLRTRMKAGFGLEWLECTLRVDPEVDWTGCAECVSDRL